MTIASADSTQAHASTYSDLTDPSGSGTEFIDLGTGDDRVVTTVRHSGQEARAAGSAATRYSGGSAPTHPNDRPPDMRVDRGRNMSGTRA